MTLIRVVERVTFGVYLVCYFVQGQKKKTYQLFVQLHFSHSALLCGLF